MEAVFDAREEALESSNLTVLMAWAGEVGRCLPLMEAEATEAEMLGRLARAARGWSQAAFCQVALGRLEEAQRTIGRAEALAARLGSPLAHLLNARDALSWALDLGWEELLTAVGPLAVSTAPALAWALGSIRAIAARAAARLGRTDEALGYLDGVLPWLERAPAWTATLPVMAHHAAETLWLLERPDQTGVIERALREKVVGPDFRYPDVDGRSALALMCALTGRHDEAVDWFAEARRVLIEQGALPLLAVSDHDEALMYARRGSPGDTERARPLLAAARRQFEDLGMTGWLRRADELAARLG